MVTLLIPTEEKSGKHKGERTHSLLSSSALLRPPMPPVMKADGRFPITQLDINYMSAHPELGGELTSACRKALGRECYADYVLVDSAVLCGLDSSHMVHYHAVGKKMDAIAMRHGKEVAREILDILGQSPIEIYTPRKQIDECYRWNGYDDDDESQIWSSTERTVGSLFPKWSWMTEKDWFERKQKLPKPMPLPKDLEKLIDDCNAVQVELNDWPDWVDAYPFPFATISWQAGPWAPDWLIKSTCPSLGAPDRSEGDDPSWIHLKPAFRDGMETGAMMFVPHPPCHSEDELIGLLEQCKPYLTLLDYITHETG